MGNRYDAPRPGAGAGGGGTGSQRPPVSYFHEGRLREDLVDKEAEAEARRLADVNRTQVRAYFFEVTSLRRRVEQEIGEQSGAVAEAIFLKHRPQLKMLRAKVHYAKARKSITEDMKDFIEKHVQAVNSFNDFMAFCTHFEAVVAFHRGLSER
jgi:CRISPR-associated protein Csm2